MQDGEGQLADGTKYKRESGETKGKNGHWFRWTKLSGVSPAGKVQTASTLLSNSTAFSKSRVISLPWELHFYHVAWLVQACV